MSRDECFEQIIYGVPLEDGDALLEINSAEFGEDLIPTVGCYSYPYGDHDFDDVIEILAHIDSDNEYCEQVCEVTASPLPLPVPLPSHLACPYPLASAEPKMPIVTYAYPEQGFSGEDVQAHPVENHSYPATYPKSYPHYTVAKTCGESKFDEECKFGEQLYYENSVKSDAFNYLDEPFICEKREDKVLARTAVVGDEVWGWADGGVWGTDQDFKAEMLKKKNRRRNYKPIFPPSGNSLTSGYPSYLSPSPNPTSTLTHPVKQTSARQVATSKREREGGRFKRARTKWVSVPDLFKTNSGSL